MNGKRGGGGGNTGPIRRQEQDCEGHKRRNLKRGVRSGLSRQAMPVAAGGGPAGDAGKIRAVRQERQRIAR